MASELRVDRIIPTSGVPTGGGGSVIQVVQATKTDTASVTGFNWTDMGLSASITPKLSSNKILVMIQANIGASVGYDMKARLMRDSTPLHIGDASGTYRPRASVSITQSYSSTANYAYDQAIINYLDSPSTTSSTTYKLQMASYSGNVVYINRNGADLDNAAGYDARTASSIILMEVSG